MKIFHILFILFLNQNVFNLNCLSDEFLNISIGICEICHNILVGCGKCEINSTTNNFQCTQCLIGYKANLNKDNIIIKCEVECEYPYTINNIPLKELYEACPLNLWLNFQSSNYIYHYSLKYDYINFNHGKTSDIEKLGLELFYKETNGDFWINKRNWLIGDPCLNNWYGIECNLRNEVISIIFKDSNFITGIISSDSIKKFQNLQKFIIINPLNYYNEDNSNRIFSISNEIFLLPNLKEVYIKNCKLYANVTNLLSLQKPSKVDIINFDNNLLYGTLPDFSFFSNLKRLSLSKNQIEGNLNNLETIISNIEVIQLNSNKFIGTVPILNNIQKKNSLEVLDLRNNIGLEGDLPNNFFSKDYFTKLKYIGLILTYIKGPDQCKNHAICIKRTLIDIKSIYDKDFELTEYEFSYMKPR